ncbi:MAG: AAA domain-containing protein [Gemmataceae bacterium]
MPSLWEQVCERASAAERCDLLSLANKQGCLFAHQLPGQLAWQVIEHPELAERQPLSTPIQLNPLDPSLDAWQREAVAKGLSTPDLCLIQGLPGTGKSRVAAELVQQACRRGERVLLLSATKNAVERVLDAIEGGPEVLPYCLPESAEDERARTRNVRLEQRFRQIAEDARTQAKQDLAAVEVRCQEGKERSRHVARLQELADQLARLQQPAARNGNGSHEVAEREVGAGATALAHLRSRTAETRERLADLHQRLDDLNKLSQARASKQWWTLSWWRATFTPGLPEESVQLESACDLTRRELDQLLGEEQRLLETEQSSVATCTEPAPKSPHEEQIAVLRREWDELYRRAALSNGKPAEPCTDAVLGLERIVSRQREEDEQHCTFVRQWLACIEEEGVRLPGHWLAYANLIGATLKSTSSSQAETVFDLCVVQEAEQLTSDQLRNVARGCRRLVLIGEPEKLAGKGQSTEAGSFAGLWQRLHADPRRLPYSWHEDNDRLSCRLYHVAEADRRFLESENVADHADIELRILDRPGERPVLAEVVFPTALGIAEAMQYIQRELDELPLAPASPSMTWSQRDNGGCELGFALDLPAGETVAVELATDVHARVVKNGTKWETLGLEFGASFDQVRAADWVAQRLGLRDLGRTVRLDVPHRMHPGLASFLSQLLFAGEYRAPANGTTLAANGVQVEFVSVMPLAEPPRTKDRRKKHTDGPARPHKEGAGLELDLADQKNHERLPAALRNGLPGVGYVNYVEAQAVLRTLEKIASDPEHCAQLGRKLAVIALYPAQAALIRGLVAQSAALKGSGLDIEIDVPSTFCQRESGLVLLSLTRSHRSRAVAFGDGPRSLALALTRARSKLILFGDPGTLFCRSQWSGPVDHLDGHSADQERELIAHLVRYLEGQGPCQRAFCLRACGNA